MGGRCCWATTSLVSSSHRLQLTSDHADPNVAVRTTPAEAAAAWIEVAKLRTEGKKLVSPAIATDMAWLKEWFSLLPPEAKPDYLAVHVYTTTFESFRDKVTEYYNTFGLPIIVTEFAMTVSRLHMVCSDC